VDLGEYDGAVQQYQEIIQLWPNDPKGYYFLAQIYAKKGESEKAFEVVQQAYQKDPRALADLMIIGDVLLEGSAYSTARKVYELVLRTDPQSGPAKEKLQLTLNAADSRL
jgi:tetratricopeptide (TPR) repeat protein